MVDLSKIKLEYKDIIGSGKQIHANLGDQSFDCVEFKIPKNRGIPIVHAIPLDREILIGYNTWVQFAPEAWKELMDGIFTELVTLWNEKYKKGDTQNDTTKLY